MLRFLLTALLALFPFLSGVGHAEGGERVYDAGQRVNIAGRQRMLSQRMAKAACMAMIGVDAEDHREELRVAHRDFQDALHVLRHGDPAKGLAAETHREVLSALNSGEVIWQTFGPAVQQMAAGDLHSVVVRQMIQLNTPLLTRMNDTVVQIAARKAVAAEDGALVTTINIAGRQRMLSQKLAKEACLIAAGFNPQKHWVHLAEVRSLFDSSLTALHHGAADHDIVAPPNTSVKVAHENVAVVWGELQALLDRVDAAGVIAPGDAADISRKANAILKLAHEAVLAYL